MAMNSTLRRSGFSLSRTILIGVAAIVVVVVLFLFFFSLWWVFITAGVLIFAASFLLKGVPKYAAGGELIDSDFDLEMNEMSDNEELDKALETVMAMESWDEKVIARLLRPRKNGFNPSFLIEQIMSRFVDGQEARTMEKRVAFLGQQNEAVRVCIENGNLMGELKRVRFEQYTAVGKAKAAAERVKDEAKRDKLRIEAETQEILVRIAQAKKQQKDLKKTAAPQTKELSEEELNQIALKKIERRIEVFKKEIGATNADPTIEKGIKVAKLNALHDELAQAEAERIRLL